MASRDLPDGRPRQNGTPMPLDQTRASFAHQMLNPKGFAANPIMQGNQRPISAPLSSRPVQNFTFDSPVSSNPWALNMAPQAQNMTASYANGNAAIHGYGQQNGQVMGMGQMLDRRYNVSEREAMLPKRRKVMDESNPDGVKAQFSGGGKAGVLGQYVSDQREQGRKQAVANGVKSVDLTGGDDEDVVVVMDPGDKEVCYGRIEGADINAHHVPAPKPGAQALSEGFWPAIKLILKRFDRDREAKTNCVQIVDCTRSIIGCLDINTAIGIVPLLDSQWGIRTAARILSRAKRDDDLPPGSMCSKRFNIDLTVYGPRRFAQAVGKHLSQKNIWLRPPLLVEAGREVCNPHAMQKPPTAVRSAYSSTSGAGFSMRTVEEIRNDVIGMFDSLEKSETLPEVDPDPRVTTDLLSHQRQGLYFMTNKEKERVFAQNEADNNSLWRMRTGNSGQKRYVNIITGQEEKQSPPQVLGGILADMMGLGKTLSILSLIVGTLDEAEEWGKREPRAVSADEVPLKRNSKTTLLVAPLSTIVNWEEQIQQHIKPGALKYYIYHGANRTRCTDKLSDYDIIITTYGSIASEYGSREKNKLGPFPIAEINWFRIVLDEAHMIREQNTMQSKAICRLNAQRRWAVTGTPVQNRLEDLGALIKFLRLKPFDEKGGFSQFILAPCKNADPEILPKLRLLVDSITLRRLKDRIDLPKRTDRLIKLRFNPEERQLYDIFAKNASDRVQVITSQQEKSLGGRSYVHILQSILRLRLICAHGKDLLSQDDLKIMEGLSSMSAIDLDDNDEDDEEQPALTPKQAYDMYNLMKETNTDTCSMCAKKIGPQDAEGADGDSKDETIGYMTPCFQLLCQNCIKPYKKSAEEKSTDKNWTNCPLCNMHIRKSYFMLKQGKVEEDEDARADAKDGPKQAKVMPSYCGPHSKTQALINDLLQSRFESELMPDEPPIKSVIFSGWTSHLDLIQLALNANSIPFVRLDGKMTRAARTQSMDTFRNDPSIPVILVSITAGGLGLNLTTANKVYVMEPQYNPAAEAQAIDRVHRLGQKREVETVRYIMEDSFEEKMLELQEKKKKLASLSLDRDGKGAIDKAEANRKRLEDLRSLFK